MNAKDLYTSLWVDNGTHSEDVIIARLDAALATARREERERCIETVLDFDLPFGRENALLNDIADAIRALSDVE